MAGAENSYFATSSQTYSPILLVYLGLRTLQVSALVVHTWFAKSQGGTFKIQSRLESIVKMNVAALLIFELPVFVLVIFLQSGSLPSLTAWTAFPITLFVIRSWSTYSTSSDGEGKLEESSPLQTVDVEAKGEEIGWAAEHVCERYSCVILIQLG